MHGHGGASDGIQKGVARDALLVVTKPPSRITARSLGLLFNEPCSFPCLPRSSVVGNRWPGLDTSNPLLAGLPSDACPGPELSRSRERERERGMADIYKACLPNFYLESGSWSQLGNGGKELQYLEKSRLRGRGKWVVRAAYAHIQHGAFHSDP